MIVLPKNSNIVLLDRLLTEQDLRHTLYPLQITESSFMDGFTITKPNTTTKCRLHFTKIFVCKTQQH